MSLLTPCEIFPAYFVDAKSEPKFVQFISTEQDNIPILYDLYGRMTLNITSFVYLLYSLSLDL